MDINASTLSALASERIASQVSTKVAVKSLDAMKQAGQAAVALIQDAAKAQQMASEAASGSLDVTA
ncbi:MAG: hypothetical protein ACOYPS_01355 [Phycisphaerales bacterium]|jgi:hypothetical protein